MAAATANIRKWGAQEQIDLVEELKNNESIADIAKKHNRSEGAVHIRIKKLALEEYNKDSKEVANICEKYRLKPEDLEKQKEYEAKKAAVPTSKAGQVERAKRLLQEALTLL